MCEIPYFDALHRWDNDEDVEEASAVRMDGVSTETVQLMLRFLLVKDLDGVNLKFDQVLTFCPIMYFKPTCSKN